MRELPEVLSFNPNFLNHILLNLITNTEFSKTVISVLNEHIDIFKTKERKFLFKLVRDYILEFKEAPQDHFYDIFKSEESRLSKKEYKRAMEVIRSLKDLNHSNPEFIINRLRDAIAHFEFEESLVNAARLHKAGNMEEAKALIMKAMRKPEEIKRSYYNFFEDTSYVEDRMRGPVYDAKTLVEPLDDLIGGMNKGWLIFVLGPTKGGKTRWLIELTIAFALQGLNVLFISLEMGKKDIDKAFDQAIGFLGDKPNEVIETMKYVKGQWCKVKMEVPTIYDLDKVAKARKAIKKMGGLIYISDQTGGKFNCNDTEFLMDKIEEEEGIIFDAVVTDYLFEMGPTEPGQSTKERLTSNTSGEKRIAQERNVIKVNAHQGNRKALRAKTFQSDMIAEDINIIFKSDLILAICQTEKEEELNQYRMFVGEYRHGPKHGSVPLVRDLSRGQIALGRGKDIKLEDNKKDAEEGVDF